jgi:hypothetical protein
MVQAGWWIVAVVHMARTDAVELLVFGCAFVTCRLPVDLNREGRERLGDLWALHPASYVKRFPSSAAPSSGRPRSASALAWETSCRASTS